MLTPTQRAGQSQVSGLSREGVEGAAMEGAAGEGLAQVGKEGASLGRDLKAGLGAGAQVMQGGTGQTSHTPRGKETPLPGTVGETGVWDTVLALKVLEVWRRTQSPHHSFMSSAQFQSPPHHHLL